MQELGPAPPTPTKEELIAQLSRPISKVIASEMADEADIDRIWILRKIHKAYLYYRDLAYFAPALFQGLVDSTGIDGSLIPDSFAQGAGIYDYTQNVYRGYCRKEVAVLGTRIPNAIAVPDDPTNEADISAARTANDAAQYIRQECDLQVLIIWLVFSLFNFGTSFWNIEWVVDGERFGWKSIPQTGSEQIQLGGGDPELGSGEGLPAEVPQELPPQRIAKGGLEINIYDASEISVPLDTDGRKGIDAALRLRREHEEHKAELIAKYGEKIREFKGDKDALDDPTASSLYGESVRSAMASPIGVVRPKRENRWTEVNEEWTSKMYNLIDEKAMRELLQQNFPDGVKITAVKGRIVDLEPRKLRDHWQECQPEPTKRIMCDPLGDDWIVTQDLLNNLLNQASESIERSNEPGFADPTRVDLDAWQRRRDEPGDLIPALRPPGGTLADIIFRPPPVQFSEQIPPFRQQVEGTSKEVSGLLDPIWGGDTSDPTARQTELKTNAAIRQLSTIWVMIGKSLEKVYEKACRLLSENEDGVLSFAKKNQFGKFDQVSIVIEELRSGSFHFEADEAIPMTWGQQRDLLMWMLDKPAEILKAWGLDDPLNIYEFKSLLGMPGMRVPHLDDRDKGMAIIGQLLQSQPQPGQPGPDGAPGPTQPSIAPAWEDDHEFMAKLAKAYLTNNYQGEEANPAGFDNVRAWGQAHETMANQPPPPPPVKGSVALSLKGEDLGDPAVTAAIQKTGLVPDGVVAQQQPKIVVPKIGPDGRMPPPNGAPPVPTGPGGL